MLKISWVARGKATRHNPQSVDDEGPYEINLAYKDNVGVHRQDYLDFVQVALPFAPSLSLSLSLSLFLSFSLSFFLSFTFSLSFPFGLSVSLFLSFSLSLSRSLCPFLRSFSLPLSSLPFPYHSF